MRKIEKNKLKKSFASLFMALIIALSGTTVSIAAIDPATDENILDFYVLVQNLNLTERQGIVDELVVNNTDFELISGMDTTAKATAVHQKMVAAGATTMSEADVKDVLDKMVAFNNMTTINQLITQQGFKVIYNALIAVTTPTGADETINRINRYTLTYRLFVNQIRVIKLGLLDMGISDLGNFDGTFLYNPYLSHDIELEPAAERLIQFYMDTLPAGATKDGIQDYIDLLRLLMEDFNARPNAEKDVVINDLATNYDTVLVRLGVAPQFNDVSPTDWFYEAITYMSVRGFILGVTPTQFAPNATITRAEFLVLLMRAYEIELDNPINDNFSDAGDRYYTPYLATAKRMGITLGVGNNKFAPERNISRQDMAVMLYRALFRLEKLPSVLTGKTLANFTDANQIASYAFVAMKLFVETGVINGTSATKLSPRASTKRSHAAQIIYNLQTMIIA